MKRLLLLISSIAALAFAVTAAADTIGPIGFDSPYVAGDIDNQQGWSNSGHYDANVLTTERYDFGGALQISNARTSGSFGDQTFSPGVVPAGEETDLSHFTASFRIGSVSDDVQPGLAISVSPDNGQGARMSYLGFADDENGIQVSFYDVTDPGPPGTVADFNKTDIATLDRTVAHTVRFWMHFKQGPANDQVKIFIDGKQLVVKGTTWEDYYRYDPEQAGGGNQLPTTSKLLFRAGGTAMPDNEGNGFLIDDVSLSSW